MATHGRLAMSVMLHVVRIRECVQCGDILPTKCERCAKHPNRKPKIIELYEFPQPLKAAECGCCFLFNCQKPDCRNTFWRSVKNNVVKGRTRSANLVCSRECRAWIANESRMNATELPCGWCSKMITRQRAKIPTGRIVFCNGGHWQLYRKRKHLEAKQILRREEDRRALVHCPTCNDVVECQETSLPSNGYSVSYQCLDKGHKFKLGRSATKVPA